MQDDLRTSIIKDFGIYALKAEVLSWRDLEGSANNWLLHWRRAQREISAQHFIMARDLLVESNQANKNSFVNSLHKLEEAQQRLNIGEQFLVGAKVALSHSWPCPPDIHSINNLCLGAGIVYLRFEGLVLRSEEEQDSPQTGLGLSFKQSANVPLTDSVIDSWNSFNADVPEDYRLKAAGFEIVALQRNPGIPDRCRTTMQLITNLLSGP
jgi:hypothetical protein